MFRFRFFQLLASAKLAYILIIILALYLGYYIIKPEQQEEFVAHKNIFFRILLFSITINIIFGTIKRFSARLSQVGFILTHIGLITIIIGAAISSFTGKRGLLMIEEGSIKDSFITPWENTKVNTEGKISKTLFPFYIKLLKFSIDYYHNSFIPRDYISEVEIVDNTKKFIYEIKMNKPLKYKGYELFQSDFAIAAGNEGKNVSILSVNYDSGKKVCFIGFLILALGVINLFLLKNFWYNLENKFVKYT